MPSFMRQMISMESRSPLYISIEIEQVEILFTKCECCFCLIIAIHHLLRISILYSLPIHPHHPIKYRLLYQLVMHHLYGSHYLDGYIRLLLFGFRHQLSPRLKTFRQLFVVKQPNSFNLDCSSTQVAEV